MRPSTFMVRWAIRFSPSALGCTITGLVPWSDRLDPAGAERLAGVVAVGDPVEVHVGGVGGGRGPADRVVEGALQAAQVGHVTLGDRHLVEAADLLGQDPRVADDRDLGPRGAAMHLGQRLDQRRVGGVADGVLERAAVLVAAGASLAEGRGAGGTALDDRVDEDAAVVAADRHRDQLGALRERLELRRHAVVLRRRRSRLVSAAPQVTSVRSAPIFSAMRCG